MLVEDEFEEVKANSHAVETRQVGYIGTTPLNRGVMMPRFG
jgi:hypothetical protein